MKKKDQLQRGKQNSDKRCSAVGSVTVEIKHTSEHFQADLCSFMVEQNQ